MGDKPGLKFLFDVSYMKCSDGTLYLLVIKDYLNRKIASLSTSYNNDTNLIRWLRKQSKEETEKYIHWHNYELIQKNLG